MVIAPKKSQTMPSRTTSAQSRHTATGPDRRGRQSSTPHRRCSDPPPATAEIPAAGRPVMYSVAAVCRRGHVHRAPSVASTMRNASTTTARRRRTNVRALCYPFTGWRGDGHRVQLSPPVPSSAIHGPSLTQYCWYHWRSPSGSCFRYCASALPPCGGNRLQFHRRQWHLATLATRTTGSTGIISSVTAKRCCSRWFYKQQSRLFRNPAPIAAAIFAASRPTQVTLTVPFPAPVDIFQQHRLQLLRLLQGQFHRMLAFHQTHQFIGYAHRANNQHFFVGTNELLRKRAFDDGLVVITVGGFIHHYRRKLPAPAAIRRLLVCLRAASTSTPLPVTTKRPGCPET